MSSKYTVKFVNEDGGVTVATDVATIEEARQIAVSAYNNGDIDSEDIAQIWSDDDDLTAVEEFGSDEL